MVIGLTAYTIWSCSMCKRSGAELDHDEPDTTRVLTIGRVLWQLYEYLLVVDCKYECNMVR